MSSNLTAVVTFSYTHPSNPTSSTTNTCISPIHRRLGNRTVRFSMQRPKQTYKEWNVVTKQEPLRWSSAKIGTIQRRLAWPLRKDDTHKSRSIALFVDHAVGSLMFTVLHSHAVCLDRLVYICPLLVRILTEARWGGWEAHSTWD